MTFSKLKALVTLLAIPLGFGLAVWFGREAEAYSKPSDFKRFHFQISPESFFYPPFSMLENIALARWSPGKTLVIIAGNSILNGYGQIEKDLWSLRLQEEIGSDYVVVNLAFRGTLPCEAGTLVAESLIKRGLPVILVTNTSPGTVGRVTGGTYGYLFYDAFYKGRLLDHPSRLADIDDWEMTATPAEQEQQKEVRRGEKLDSLLHFQALWHHLGYRVGFTVWSQLTRPKFWQPRDRFPDNVPGSVPLAGRFETGFDDQLAIARGFSVNLAEPDGRGGWRMLQPPIRVTADLIDAMFPPAVRARTILLLNQNAPVFRTRFTASERARDELVFSAYEKLWRDHGVSAHVVSADFIDDDYMDRTHLSASGGKKLARVTADFIRQMPSP